jgi:putative CocE/NonD family hydrolase
VRALNRLAELLFGLSPRCRDIEVHRDLRVPMPDGVELLADRYCPRGGAPGPVVLVRTPYGRRGLLGLVLGDVLARQGFQVLLQSVRGTFGSGGEFHPFHQEHDDGLATVAWLRGQTWFDGTLATAGPSYLGYTQWALAPYLDPPPAAVALGVTASQFTSNHYPGGSMSLLGAMSWATLTATQEHTRFGGLLPDREQARRLRRAMGHLPLREADIVSVGRPIRYWRDVVEHARPGDDFWQPTDHSAAVAGLTSPVSMVTGWYDLFLPWQLRDFRALVDAGRQPRITVGPWAHSDPGLMKAMLTDQVSWLHTHLHGEPAPERPAPIRAFLQHADTWLDLPSWPPPAQPTALYLHPAGRLDWQPPPESPPDEFTYDPGDPTPSVGGPLLNGQSKQRDNRSVERRDDVLVYSTEPLPDDLDVVGELTAHITVRTDPPHADVFVRLCDVDRHGVSRNVSDGIRRLAAGDDEPTSVTLDMWPTAYRFRRGHRVRLQVTGGAFPRYPRNHGNGSDIADAVAMQPTRHHVFHDPQRPSRLLLPVWQAAAGP